MEIYDYSALLTVVKKIGDDNRNIHTQHIENLRAEYEELLPQIEAIGEDIKQLYKVVDELHENNRKFSIGGIRIFIDDCYITDWRIYHYIPNPYIIKHAVYSTFVKDDVRRCLINEVPSTSDEIGVKIKLAKNLIKGYPEYRSAVLEKIYEEIGKFSELNEKLRKEYGV